VSLVQIPMTVPLLGEQTAYAGPVRSFTCWFNDPARAHDPDDDYQILVQIADLRAAVALRL
jgi:hypothetical protein